MYCCFCFVVVVFLGGCIPKLWIEFELSFEEKKTCDIMTCGMNNLEIDCSLRSVQM